jgi:hypothetical protein
MSGLEHDKDHVQARPEVGDGVRKVDSQLSGSIRWSEIIRTTRRLGGHAPRKETELITNDSTMFMARVLGKNSGYGRNSLRRWRGRECVGGRHSGQGNSDLLHHHDHLQAFDAATKEDRSSQGLASRGKIIEIRRKISIKGKI